MKKRKVFQLITVSKSVYLLKGQIEYLRKNDINMHLISSEGKELEQYPNDIIHKIEMNREISILKDIKSLLNLICLFIKERPYIVNAGTPKAGLLGMIASYITRRPHRVYTVRGLRLETVSGIKYKILFLMEKIAMFCATDIIAISESLKTRVIELNLNNGKNIIVFGNGSSNGLNLKEYSKNNNKIENDILKKLNGQFVIGYLGRLVKDKGIEDLIKAFKIIEKKYSNVKLLVIGSIEDGDSISKNDLTFILENKNVVYKNHVDNPVNYYNNMDVFIFPTYREGFGNVSIEAQALGIPTITYNVTGAKDTVINNETGFIVEPGDYVKIAEKIELLLINEKLKARMGTKGEEWVNNNFSNEIIWEKMMRFYNFKLKERK
ncbi:glycosyltransferase family 4 protein [Staphylococcus aureus]|uniref:glycosyltransferase family 4 protein n=1 Tax=Staphylococcus aureus TaxID=1280 RepID=UPI000A7DEAF9|nr:glycosyltransferase family 4 protein [Staphylococcus aureus]PZH16931.1 glycosyltransferase family 1 protein [Staphylococcus aureus]HCC5684857.1 glycosyltransferase family 4 protein [Staphylococcus aureus]HCY6734602.1 glycosyltransferase family 4 protein [Staphylococcus aureus]HCY7991492.1 glycosyltransferase family 4 protein [Staphylococcus aureus]